MRHLQYRGELGLGLLPGLSRRPGHPALSILTPSGQPASSQSAVRERRSAEFADIVRMVDFMSAAASCGDCYTPASGR